jgi:hypothetical protein
LQNVEITSDSLIVTFKREPEEGLISSVAEEGSISEDEAWEKVSNFFEGLLDQDVETDVADYIAQTLGVATKEPKSLWSWKHENGKLESFSNDSLTYVVYRDYFNFTLERKLTDGEWNAVGEILDGAVQHDHEVDLHYADVQELLD